MTLTVIFCADLLDPKSVDSLYEHEAAAVRALGGVVALIDFEALTSGAAEQAVRRVPLFEPVQDAVYRGWMLKPVQYQQLYNALHGRGVRLINDPYMYRHAHYLPESYPVIEALTPRSVWLPLVDGLDMDAVTEALQVFGDAPVVVKDYVKSQKHYWHEAFFIPKASDREQVSRVVRRFLELQGDDLNVGMVFREFVEFEPLAQHSQSGMPLTKEFRLFFLDGAPIYTTRYWSEGDYEDVEPEVGPFLEVERSVRSRFFTIDIAKRTNGDWMIVELGDAQVAGLPDHADVQAFYQEISESLEGNHE